MNDEIWRNIPNYEGLYKVSNLGRVRSVDRLVTYKNGVHHLHKGKLISYDTDVNGYYYIYLYKHGKRKAFKVHRLVALAFISNPHHYPCINHKDENRQNNNVNNLEWCTVKYNNNYGHHAIKERKSMLNNKLKSKPVLQYTKDGKFINEWPSCAEAGRHGFDPSSVIRCCKGRSKTCGGYKWKYGLKPVVEKTTDKVIKKGKGFAKPVIQFTLDNRFVGKWSFIAEAGKHGFTRTHIEDCCLGRQNQHKGYKWKYASDIG